MKGRILLLMFSWHFCGARSLYQDRYFQESTQQLIFPGPGKSLWSRILDSVLPVQRPRPDPWLENPKPTTQKAWLKKKGKKQQTDKTQNKCTGTEPNRNKRRSRQKREKKEQKSLKMKTIRTKPRERAKESNHKHIKWSKRTKAKKKSKLGNIYAYIF